MKELLLGKAMGLKLMAPEKLVMKKVVMKKVVTVVVAGNSHSLSQPLRILVS